MITPLTETERQEGDPAVVEWLDKIEKLLESLQEAQDDTSLRPGDMVVMEENFNRPFFVVGGWLQRTVEKALGEISEMTYVAPSDYTQVTDGIATYTFPTSQLQRCEIDGGIGFAG